MNGFRYVRPEDWRRTVYIGAIAVTIVTGSLTGVNQKICDHVGDAAIRVAAYVLPAAFNSGAEELARRGGMPGPPKNLHDSKIWPTSKIT